MFNEERIKVVAFCEGGMFVFQFFFSCWIMNVLFLLKLEKSNDGGEIIASGELFYNECIDLIDLGSELLECFHKDSLINPDISY
jgi:hypothetical protein